MRFEDKIVAINLRRKGRSYSEILKKIKVSKSTLSNWMKDIKLTPEQNGRLTTKRELAGYKGAKANQKYTEKRRRLIIEQARNEVPQLIKNPLFLAGLMLYWAEGGKTEEKVKFSNSDSSMIKLMMRWFREICHIPEHKFRITLYLHTLHVRKDARNFWSNITGIPPSQFTKDMIKSTIYSQRTNKLYEGTCRIAIHSVDLFRKITGWQTGTIEYFGKQKNLSADKDPAFIEGVIFRQMSKWSQNLSD